MFAVFFIGFFVLLWRFDICARKKERGEMLGAGCQLTRGGRHGEDPFYYSSAKGGARKPNNNHQRAADQMLRRAQSDVSNGRSANNNPKEQQRREEEAEGEKESSPSGPTNLEHFLESVTPSVPAQYLPKVCLNLSNTRFIFLKQ